MEKNLDPVIALCLSYIEIHINAHTYIYIVVDLDNKWHFLADDEIETPKAHDDQGLEVSQLKFVVSNSKLVPCYIIYSNENNLVYKLKNIFLGVMNCREANPHFLNQVLARAAYTFTL